MLQPIDQAPISDQDRLTNALRRHWDAIDVESGAFLKQTNGRGKGGLPTYILILPNKSVAERGGLFADYDWDNRDRKFIRAWTLEEAIKAANKKLAKMVVR